MGSQPLISSSTPDPQSTPSNKQSQDVGQAKSDAIARQRAEEEAKGQFCRNQFRVESPLRSVTRLNFADPVVRALGISSPCAYNFTSNALLSFVNEHVPFHSACACREHPGIGQDFVAQPKNGKRIAGIDLFLSLQ